MTDNSRVPPPPPRDPYDDEINVREWMRMFLRQRSLIIGAACAGALLAALVAYAFPPDYVATTQLIFAARPNTEVTSAMVANYRRELDSLEVAQQVVDELGLDKAPHQMSALRLRSQTVVSAADAAGILTIEVRSDDPDLATSAADSLARHGGESARKAEVRARMLTQLGLVLKLRQELPDLLSQIQGEETAQQVIQDQLKDPSLRSVSLQREVILGRVRLAQLRARWDHIVKNLDAAARLAESLDRLPPNSDVPALVISEHDLLTQSFGVVAGERAQFESPLRLLSKAAVSEPPGLRRWATNLALGFVLGLLVAMAISVVYYVVFTARKPGIPRPTPE